MSRDPVTITKVKGDRHYILYFIVIVVTFLMTLFMNKFTNNVTLTYFSSLTFGIFCILTLV